MIFKPAQQELPEVKKIKPARGGSAFGGKKVKPPFINGRWAIVGLFLITAAASLFFYLQIEAPLLWQKITSPAVISTLPGRFDPTPVFGEIESLTKDLRGTYGLYVYRLDEKIEYGLHQDEVFPAASLIKLPVMLTLYQEAEKGNLDLADYKKMAEAMGKRSDNTVFNQLVKILGEEEIQRTIDDLGMSKTLFKKNETTPADIGLFFQKLYEGEVISAEHKNEILNFLTDTDFEDRIPAGIPEGIRVAHKIGTELGSFSDAGIIFADKPFILVIISKNARESEANQVLPKIAKIIWEFETR